MQSSNLHFLHIYEAASTPNMSMLPRGRSLLSASVKSCRLEIQSKPLCFSGRRVKKRLVGLRFGLPPFVRPSGEEKGRWVRHSGHDPRGSLCGHASFAPSILVVVCGGVRRRGGREGGTVASPSVVGFDGPRLRLRLTTYTQFFL